MRVRKVVGVVRRKIAKAFAVKIRGFAVALLPFGNPAEVVEARIDSVAQLRRVAGWQKLLAQGDACAEALRGFRQLVIKLHQHITEAELRVRKVVGVVRRKIAKAFAVTVRGFAVTLLPFGDPAEVVEARIDSVAQLRRIAGWQQLLAQGDAFAEVFRGLRQLVKLHQHIAKPEQRVRAISLVVRREIGKALAAIVHSLGRLTPQIGCPAAHVQNEGKITTCIRCVDVAHKRFALLLRKAVIRLRFIVFFLRNT